MKVCYFGIYNPTYSRNKILTSGLKSNGVEVIECRTDKKGIVKYFDLIRKHWNIRNNYDVMIVGYPGFQSVILVKFLTRKPIIFDAFISMYDSMVLDRKQVSKGSLRAGYYWWLDKVSMSVADLILIDTNEHKKYISEAFNIDSSKIERVYVGADTEIFYPKENKRNDGLFRVLFFGTYIPLQGVEYIVRTAKLLENKKDIVFELIGNGQEKEKILKLASELKVSNINFRDNIKIVELSNEIALADVCLGIFGNTGKAKRVIPNKVYECVAMKKPVITADTLAERELFNNDDLFFTKISDPESIADAIMTLKDNSHLLKSIAENGYKKFTKEAIPNKISFDLIKVIESKI
ncbi:MAG: Group 1 glycosyl transferase [Parcubacteria group bacterium GW2011_GWF2_38_76]|nr:MAG: Group 1 glycosyl transferase [Parcubacteria group bacterium GW2011_GWF2_38_76]HBM45759.1 glycosyl transferase family 1 [Patescibacteria group bacterium]